MINEDLKFSCPAEISLCKSFIAFGTERVGAKLYMCHVVNSAIIIADSHRRSIQSDLLSFEDGKDFEEFRYNINTIFKIIFLLKTDNYANLFYENFGPIGCFFSAGVAGLFLGPTKERLCFPVGQSQLIHIAAHTLKQGVSIFLLDNI